MSVADYFSEFNDALRISTDKRETISTRYNSICKRLNLDFWNMDTSHGGRYIGSYGRNTANSWVSDIDFLFELPRFVYDQYNGYSGNGQSALLQAVKKSVIKTYSSTEVGADGQVVKISFTDNIDLELLPSFKNDDNTYTFPNSNNGGSWESTNPIAEIDAIRTGDSLANNNLRHLCRMCRSWKHYNDVQILGILIDTLAYRFIADWAEKDKGFLYYDWLSRDFFYYLSNLNPDQTVYYALGSNKIISNYGNFVPKAKKAYNLSVEAIQLQENDESAAKQKWKEIYGYRFPT